MEWLKLVNPLVEMSRTHFELWDSHELPPLSSAGGTAPVPRSELWDSEKTAMEWLKLVNPLVEMSGTHFELWDSHELPPLCSAGGTALVPRSELWDSQSPKNSLGKAEVG